MTIKAQDSFSSVIDAYKSAMGGADQATKQSADKFDLLTDGIKGFAAAWGAVQLASGVLDFWRAGDALREVHAQFDQLSASIGDSTEIMTGLRRATNDVISDSDLMAESTLLLRTHLVSSSEELTHFLGLIQDLKPAGQDMNSAIQTFAQALQTGSARSLTSFGLSTEAVKNEMDELQAKGVSAADAFKQAFIDVGDATQAAMGAAADAGDTSLSKLEARIQNFEDKAKEAFSGVANSALDMWDKITNVNPIYEQNGIPSESLTPPQQDQLQRQDAIASAIADYINTHPKLPEGIGEHIGLPSDDMPGYGAGQNTQYLVSVQGAASLLLSIQDSVTAGWKKATDALHLYGDGQAAIGAAAAEKARQLAEQLQPFTDFLDNPALGEMTHVAAGDLTRTPGALGLDVLPPETRAPYLDQHAADVLKQDYQAIRDQADSIKTAMASVITDDQKKQLDGVVQSAKELADEGQHAADAFAKIRLPDILGQSGGGVLGDLEDKFLAVARAAGISEDALKQYQDALDLLDGRQTTASQSLDTFEKSLVGMRPDEVALANQRLEQSLKYAAQMGVPTDMLAGSYPQLAGMTPGGGQQDITIKPGQGINEVLDQYPGLTREQLMQAAGTGNGQYILPGNFQVGTPQLSTDFNATDVVNQLMKLMNISPGGAMPETTYQTSSADILGPLLSHWTPPDVGNGVGFGTSNFGGQRPPTYDTSTQDILGPLLNYPKSTFTGFGVGPNGGAGDGQTDGFAASASEASDSFASMSKDTDHVRDVIVEISSKLDTTFSKRYKLDVDTSGLDDVLGKPATPSLDLSAVGNLALPLTVDTDPAQTVIDTVSQQVGALFDTPHRLDVSLPDLSGISKTVGDALAGLRLGSSELPDLSALGAGASGMPGAPTSADPFADAADSTLRVNDNLSQADTTFQSIVESTARSRDNVEGIGDSLSDIFGQEYGLNVKLKLDAILPDWLKKLLQAGGIDFAAMLQSAVQANGGNTPGAQAQGRSTRAIER